MNYDRNEWKELKSRYGAAITREKYLKRHSKQPGNKKHRGGSSPETETHSYSNKSVPVQNETVSPKLYSFAELSKALQLETSSLQRRRSENSEAFRPWAKRVSSKSRCSTAESSNDPVDDPLSLKKNKKLPVSRCSNEELTEVIFALQRQPNLLSVKHVGVDAGAKTGISEIEDLGETKGSGSTPAGSSLSSGPFPVGCSREKSCSSTISNKSVPDSLDSGFLSNYQLESEKRKESSSHSSTSPIIPPEQDRVIRSQSNWDKIKIQFPSKKPQIQGTAIQQHPRHTTAVLSKGRRRILQRERERENAVLLDSRKLVVEDPKDLSRLWTAFPFVYKINDGSNNGSSILQQVCRERGWREYREKENVQQSFSVSSQQAEDENFVGKVIGAQSWNLWWRSTTMTPERSSFLKSWQLTNHIPKISTNFSRKDNLARILTRMRSNHATEYDFSPRCFILPQEYYRLLTVQRNRYTYTYSSNHSSAPEEKSGISFGNGFYKPREKKTTVWICKPVCKSQGKGIIVFDRVTDFSYDLPSVVQEYIERPYLINGYKWDLRLYVCITSTNPLMIYAYRGGITRFATNKYDLNNLLNQYAHLTNTFINKQSPEYRKHKDGIGLGCKWTLKKLRNHFKKENVEDYFLWQKIWSILVLTIIGDAKEITKFKSSANCFEFLGFDILVDENMKPHLLEVNTNPGLGCDEPSVDESVKKPMLQELFTLLGLPDGRHLNCLSPSNSEDISHNTSNDMEMNESKILEELIFGVKDKVNPFKNELDKVNPRKSSIWPPGCSSPSSSTHPSKRQSRYYQYNYHRQNNNVNFKAFKYHDEDCDDFIPSQAKLGSNCSSYFNVIGGENGQPELNPHVHLEIPVPKNNRTKNKLKLPLKNGPGMTMLVRNWKTKAPKACGDWIRVFPFNGVTREISGEQMDDDDMNEVIYQVNELLKLIRAIVTENPKKPYAFYDSCIQRFGSINTDIWYPNGD